ncbi:uncharacterized protein LOC133139047 [Conger conger]|uniref:uncharacterized protein LOC133139047 n=1 Tax=Conger conger TaxID=82655 RepID=UPI002A5A5A8C|nr:uncharacterized protein LOC133139047 [Conger conger]
MASTPSASALSAVLRCRGNIFARNKANKRPPPGSGYSLGVKCGAAGESGVPILAKEHGWEFGHSLQDWKSFFLGQRVEIRDGVFLAVTLEASRKNTTVMHTEYQTTVNDNELKKVSKTASPTDRIGSIDFIHASLSQPTSDRPRFRSESTNSLRIRIFTSVIRKCLGIESYEDNGVAVSSKSDNLFLEKAAACKVLCISISYLPKSDRAGEQITEPVVLSWNGWTTLKNGCIILTVIFSEMVRMQFGLENGRFSIPSVLTPVVEIPKTQSVKSQSLSISHSAQIMGKDLNGQSDTDQKVELGDGRLRTSDPQPMKEITKLGKLD